MTNQIKEPIERYGLSKRIRKKTLFSRIGVVGCGKDGSLIATIAATNGMEVVFLEPSEEQVKNAYKLGFDAKRKENHHGPCDRHDGLQRFCKLRFCN